jgi:hypothetical protein
LVLSFYGCESRGRGRWCTVTYTQIFQRKPFSDKSEIIGGLKRLKYFLFISLFLTASFFHQPRADGDLNFIGFIASRFHVQHPSSFLHVQKASTGYSLVAGTELPSDILHSGVIADRIHAFTTRSAHHTSSPAQCWLRVPLIGIFFF